MSAHADAGPSGAHGWLECPSYVTQTRGRHRKATSYTREGSAAHAVAEKLILGEPVSEGDIISIEGEDIVVTDEMLDYVEVYVHLAELLRHTSSLFLVEARVSLDWFYEPETMPEPIFGTADLVAYDEKTAVLTVVDLKYGAGVPVEAENNPQLMIYALGALGLIGNDNA